MSKRSNHLFECLNAITQKSECEYNPKEVSGYILSMFIAEYKGLIEMANNVNPYQFDLPDELIFKYYVKSVPKGYRNMKFTKKTEASKERDKQVKELMEKYGISKREAGLSC